MIPIPCPHFKISIVKRSQGQSAVAGAAYQSGERLFSEYDQKTKFYNKKKELVHAEVMLPSHAPPGYADRATLWNAVEAVENQWNSQLARRIVLAFPVEVPKKQYLKMIRDFCQEQFVSKGMIADFAIHDKGDGNPHAHILLTLRAMDEHGKWLPKARKVYDLDENGERIRLPSGNWKCHKENTVDWNDQKYAEVWRHSWETITNRYLEAAGRPERVDLRSFERQGIQQIPTVHLGPAAHQMEKRGVETFLGNLNRDIRAANSLMQSIRSAIRGLQRWIADLNEKKQLLLDAHLLPHLGEHGHVAEEGDAQHQLALRVENRIGFEDQLPPVGNGLHARGGLPRPHDLRVQHHVEPAALDELHHGMPQHLFAGDARDFGMAPVQMHDGPFHVGDADPLFEGVKKLIKILLQHYISVLNL